MPKLAREMSSIEVRKLAAPGVHFVGGVSGLALRINDGSGRSWILRTTIGAKRRDIGLGGFPDVSLAAARETAREMKRRIAEGFDPAAERQAARAALIVEQRKA